MNRDYLYCLNPDTCIHRRGCKRWIGNYTDEESIEEADNNIYGYIDDEDCLRENYDDDNVKHAFDMLARFRNSMGEIHGMV